MFVKEFVIVRPVSKHCLTNLVANAATPSEMQRKSKIERLLGYVGSFGLGLTFPGIVP